MSSVRNEGVTCPWYRILPSPSSPNFPYYSRWKQTSNAHAHIMWLLRSGWLTRNASDTDAFLFRLLPLLHVAKSDCSSSVSPQFPCRTFANCLIRWLIYFNATLNEMFVNSVATPKLLNTKKLKKENAGFLFEFGNCVFFCRWDFRRQGIFQWGFCQTFSCGIFVRIT